MNGIAILGALPGSPAERCGLRYGDILLSVNGQAMSSVEDFLAARASAAASLEVLVRRGDHIMELTLQLDDTAAPSGPNRAAKALEKVQHLRLVPPPDSPRPVN